MTSHLVRVKRIFGSCNGQTKKGLLEAEMSLAWMSASEWMELGLPKIQYDLPCKSGAVSRCYVKCRWSHIIKLGLDFAPSIDSITFRSMAGAEVMTVNNFLLIGRLVFPVCFQGAEKNKRSKRPISALGDSKMLMYSCPKVSPNAANVWSVAAFTNELLWNIGLHTWWQKFFKFE